MDRVNLRKVSEMHKGFLFMANVTWRINHLSKKTEILGLSAPPRCSSTEIGDTAEGGQLLLVQRSVEELLLSYALSGFDRDSEKEFNDEASTGFQFNSLT